MEIDFTKSNKELFETLCKRVLIAENPKTQTIDGSGGDEGADSFIGIFGRDIKIWQFKFFLHRIKDSQKKQIEKSLNTARKKHALKEWILCVPTEFSPAEEKWFQKVKNKQENKKIAISYLNEHHLRNLIQKHKPIRDEFFKEDQKEQLSRMEKTLNIIKSGSELRELMENDAYIDQISAFKIRIIGTDAESVKKSLLHGVPYRHGFGVKNKFTKKDSVLESSFFLPEGSSSMKLNLEDEENPFKLSISFSNPIKLWLKTGISQKKTKVTLVTIFTGNYLSKQIVLKAITENRPDSTILRELEFHRTIKGMVSGRDRYAKTTTTVKLDPNIIEQVQGDLEQESKNVEIRSNIIHSKEGGLPETKFMKTALSLVKSIRKEGKISDIIFFRAKQTDRPIVGKRVSLEVHNDGRVRIWYKKSDFHDKQEVMKHLDEFIDANCGTK